jgi:hypothetical protein
MLTTFCGFDPEGGNEIKRSRSCTLLVLMGAVASPASLLLLLLPLLLLLGVVDISGWLVSSSALCCQKDTVLSGVTTVLL